MRAILGELVDRVASAGRCELVGAITKPYPSVVIATVMGAPDDHIVGFIYVGTPAAAPKQHDLTPPPGAIRRLSSS